MNVCDRAQSASGNHLYGGDANNVRTIPIIVVAPDLTVTDATASEAGVLGDNVNVSWTIENQGEHPAAAQWYDAV